MFKLLRRSHLWHAEPCGDIAGVATILAVFAGAFKLLSAMGAYIWVNYGVFYQVAMGFPPSVATIIIAVGFRLAARQMYQRFTAVLTKLFFLLFPPAKGSYGVSR